MERFRKMVEHERVRGRGALNNDYVHIDNKTKMHCNKIQIL